MPLLGETRNAMLEKATESGVCTWLGLFTAEAEKGSWKSNSETEVTLTEHGYSTGDLLYVKSVTGGTGSMVKAGEFLYVKKESTSVIKLSQTSSFVAEKWSVEISAMVTEKVVEVSGGTYKRIKAKWNAIAANGQIEDTEKHEIPCKSGTVVDCVSMHTAETSGGIRKMEKVTKETVLGSEHYAINNSELDLITANLATP